MFSSDSREKDNSNASSVIRMLSNLNIAAQTAFPSIGSVQIIRVHKYYSMLSDQFIRPADKN